MTTQKWTAQRMACQEDRHYYRYEVVTDTPDEHGKTTIAMLLTEEQAKLIAEAPAMLEVLRMLSKPVMASEIIKQAREIIQRIEGNEK